MEFVESLIGNALLRNWKEDFEYLIARRLFLSTLERVGIGNEHIIFVSIKCIINKMKNLIK